MRAQTNPARTGPGWSLALPAAAAAIGAAALGALSATSALSGVGFLVLLGFCALALPTHRTLAGRVVYTVPAFSTLAFVVWLIPARVPHEDLIAAALGGALGWAVTRAVVGGRASQLLPRVDGVDVVAVLGTAAVAAKSLSHFVLASSPQKAIDVWATMWDNSSHSFIELSMRHTGLLVRYLPLSFDGTAWAQSTYPAAYHATAETLLTFYLGHAQVPAEQELFAFVRITGLLGVVGAVLAASAVATLPGVRRNPFGAAVGAGIAGSVMSAGPGAFGMNDAHYNYPFSLALVMAGVSVAVGASRVWDLRRVSVLVAVVVLGAGGWLPLGALAAGVALAVALPLDRRRWVGRPAEIVACVAVVLAGVAISVLQLTWVLSGIDANARDAGGGITRALAHQFTLAMAALIVGILWAIGRGGRRGLQWGARQRFAVAGLALLGLAAAYFWIGYDQLQTLKGIRYYPAKLQDGVVVLGSVYLGMLVALAATSVRPGSLPRPARHTVAVLAGLVCLGSFGLPLSGPLLGPEQPATPSSFRATVVKPRPDLAAALARTRDVPSTTRVAMIASGNPGGIAQDTVLLAAARGAYTNATSTWVNEIAASGANTIPKLAAFFGPQLRDGGLVVVARADIAEGLRKALPDVGDLIRNF